MKQAVQTGLTFGLFVGTTIAVSAVVAAGLAYLLIRLAMPELRAGPLVPGDLGKAIVSGLAGTGLSVIGLCGAAGAVLGAAWGIARRRDGYGA